MSEDPFAEVCYRRTFLKEVIARVDFPPDAALFDESLPEDVYKAALASFQVPEPVRNAVVRQVEISANAVKSETLLNGREFGFYGLEQEKRLTIGPTFILASYSKYTTYEDLVSEFCSVVRACARARPSLTPIRLGLRYINVFSGFRGNPLHWRNLINKNLIALLYHLKQSGPLARVFTTAEFNYGDFNVRMQFGMHNPDYPAEIRQKTFVVDLDAYHKGLVEFDEIDQRLGDFHLRIQALFEMSLGPRLRSTLET